jgi:hypothetical protein
MPGKKVSDLVVFLEWRKKIQIYYLSVRYFPAKYRFGAPVFFFFALPIPVHKDKIQLLFFF